MADKAWFGRCIFLSWYCERGTCDFCFRSTTKHQIRHPSDAKRSFASVLAEALIIRACGWRIEFLTGGYGIYDFDEIVNITRLVSQALNEKIWINLGTLSEIELDRLHPYVEGIVSSLETLEPGLHDKVCPDKPLKPYFEMMDLARSKGFKQSITIVIGLGESYSDYEYVKEIIRKYSLDRITVYALRPVKGTPYTKGPSSKDMIWWISNIRKDFPDMEIIAGTAIYRIDEISSFLGSGADAITKLPATKIFNTVDGARVEEEIRRSGKDFIGKFTCEDLEKAFDFDSAIDVLDISDEEKKNVKKKLDVYLHNFKKNRIA